MDLCLMLSSSLPECHEGVSEVSRYGFFVFGSFGTLHKNQKNVKNYKPYGQIDSDASKGPMITDYTYTGQRSDLNTGLMYYKFRYYDTSLGRFISPDDRISPMRINGLNLYSYADENPINNNDPSGHSTNYVHMFNQIVYHMLGGDKYFRQVKQDIIKYYLNEFSSQSDENAMFTYAFGVIDKRRVDKKIQRSINRGLMISTVATVIGAVCIAASFPLSAIPILGFISFAVGCILVGYGLGGIAGYLAGGYGKGRYDSKMALGGMFLGNIIGAYIGAQVGFAQAGAFFPGGGPVPWFLLIKTGILYGSLALTAYDFARNKKDNVAQDALIAIVNFYLPAGALPSYSMNRVVIENYENYYMSVYNKSDLLKRYGLRGFLNNLSFPSGGDDGGDEEGDSGEDGYDPSTYDPTVYED